MTVDLEHKGKQLLCVRSYHHKAIEGDHSICLQGGRLGGGGGGDVFRTGSVRNSCWCLHLEIVPRSGVYEGGEGAKLHRRALKGLPISRCVNSFHCHLLFL